MNEIIYLDNNATTPVDESVIQVVADALTAPGNASSVHSFGQRAKQKLTEARQVIAKELGVKPSEIVFTSGGTEALNLLIRGIMGPIPAGHVITSDLEHSAVYSTCEELSLHDKCEVTFLRPGGAGAVTLDLLKKAIRVDTKLICLMAVNNETGVKTDLPAVAAIAAEHCIPLIVDGVGLLGKEPFTFPDGVKAMAFSGHKFYAPQGVGFAVVRPGFQCKPLCTGGAQEYRRRPGTENLPGILGMAQAIKVIGNDLVAKAEQIRSLRDRFETGLRENLPDIVVHGSDLDRVSNTSNVGFPGVDGESLLMNLDLAGVAASAGSACTSGSVEPSRILVNMGVPRELATSSLRFSLSRYTTEEEIDRAVRLVTDVVTRLRSLARR